MTMRNAFVFAGAVFASLTAGTGVAPAVRRGARGFGAAFGFAGVFGLGGAVGLGGAFGLAAAFGFAGRAGAWGLSGTEGCSTGLAVGALSVFRLDCAGVLVTGEAAGAGGFFFGDITQRGNS